MSSRSKNSMCDRKEQDPSSSRPSASSQQFANSGLEHWNNIRQQWRSGAGTSASGSAPRRKSNKGGVEVEDVIARVFNPSGLYQPLKEPVALGTMIQILNEVWESEGLE